MLRDFWQKHPEAEGVLRERHTAVEHAEFKDFNHIKEMFNSADYVPPYTVLDPSSTPPPRCRHPLAITTTTYHG